MSIYMPTMIGGNKPFDIRECPIWAIPQLAHYKQLSTAVGNEVKFLGLRHGVGVGLATVAVKFAASGAFGVFNFVVLKMDMNERYQPDLYHEVLPHSRFMQVGTRVRSKAFFVDGVIQDIGPCSHETFTGVPCNKIELTLDPPSKGVRFYHHADSFEIVDPE